MDTTTSEEDPDVGNFDREIEIVDSIDNNSLSQMFTELTQCPNPLPILLLQIALFMSNISQALDEKIQLAHDGQISFNGGACYNYFATVRLTVSILITNIDAAKAAYAKEIEDYKQHTDLADLVGFETISEWAQQLVDNLKGSTSFRSDQRSLLEEVFREFFGMIGNRIIPADNPEQVYDSEQAYELECEGEPAQAGEPEQESVTEQAYEPAQAGNSGIMEVIDPTVDYAELSWEDRRTFLGRPPTIQAQLSG